MIFQEFKKQRSRLQKYTWLGLPLVLVGGWFFPALGYVVLAGAAAALLMAPSKGRLWCDWLCPMGSCYDLYLSTISRKKEFPFSLRSTVSKTTTAVILLGALGLLIYNTSDGGNGIGLSLIILLALTTLFGVAIGIRYQERGWCHICPIGSLANVYSRNKHPLRIDVSCRSCGVCELVCPMQLHPARHRKDGVLRDGDCIQCSCCVVVCPQKAIGFRK